MRIIQLLPALLLFAGCMSPVVTTPAPSAPASSRQSAGADAARSLPPSVQWIAPLSVDRVTKKPFGLYVDPEHSPVSPERFRGYHTGADFEMRSDEPDVTVRSACSGTVLLRRWVKGYGGVMVQRCMLGTEPVTVLYGHLRLSSVQAQTGDILAAGTPFAILGTGYSSETDGERRHLHFAVHRGNTIELKGYVSNAGDLTAWIDPRTLLH